MKSDQKVKEKPYRIIGYVGAWEYRSKWHAHIRCSEFNGEIKIEFGGPIKSEKEQDMFFDKTNGPNVVKFLDDFIQIHGVHQNIKLDQSKCLQVIKKFLKQNIINIITTPAYDHRTFGLVDRLIQTVKGELSCMELAKRSKKFKFKDSKKSIVCHYVYAN